MTEDLTHRNESRKSPHYPDFRAMTDDQIRAEVARVDAEYLSRLTDSELAELSASREIFVTQKDVAREEFMRKGGRK